MNEQKQGICPECLGKTILFRGKGLDTQYYLCTHWKEAGHLSEDKIKHRFEAVMKAILPSGRQA